MNYEEFNRQYNKIYSIRFNGINGTPYEYLYLEEEHYALRKREETEFIIIRARSPLEAIQNFKKFF